MHVALISLEPWDDVWRRNQYLATCLVADGSVDHVTFVEPPVLGAAAPPRSPMPGITVVRPTLRLPKRLGGLRIVAAQLRRSVLRRADVLWVNDPSLGVHCLTSKQPALYDVTDDWRTFDFPHRIVRRVIRAENRLAVRARTVVCSAVLADRWRDRYGIEPAVVHNGVDVEGWSRAEPRAPRGTGPHVGYIGTLHEERLDVDLVVRTAEALGSGTLHLVGPDSLSGSARSRLAEHPRIVLEGRVPAADVPSWAKGMDVLITPHRVSDFTLSLDAIKAYEYLSSGRPVVATATSGFQLLGDEPAITVAAPNTFAETVAAQARMASTPSTGPRRPIALAPQGMSWADRAHEFARELHLAGEVTP